MSGRSGTGEHGIRDQPNGSWELEGHFNAADECWPAHVNQSAPERLAGAGSERGTSRFCAMPSRINHVWLIVST